MTELAKVSEGVVLEYPYSRAQLINDMRAAQPSTITVFNEDGEETEIENYLDVSLPRDLGAVDLSEYDVYPVTPVESPRSVPEKVWERDGIQFVNGEWRWRWKLRDMTEDERATLVPEAVTMRQARLMALQAGFLEGIEEAISGMDEAAKIEWEYALEVRRDHPLIAQIAEALDMTDQQVDEMFIAAAAIR